MRILLVNKYWYLRGGTERVVFMTKDILEKHGHTVGVFGMQHPENIIENKYFVPEVDFDTVKGWKKIQAAVRVIYNREAKKRFVAYIQEFQPDVIHFHNIYHQLSFSLVEAAKEAGIPMVMTLHDYHMVSPNYRLFCRGDIDESSLGKHFFMCALKNCYGSVGKSIVATFEMYYRVWKGYGRMIDAFVAPSMFMKQISGRAGLDKKRIKVVYNPTEAFVAHPQVEKGPVTYIGRLSEEKGIQVLLDAAKDMHNIPFVLVGSGPEEHRLRQEAPDNVQFVGWQHGKNLERYMREAGCIVVPSLWYENCPLVILEAIAAGKLVIGSNIGGIPELLTPQTTVEDYADAKAWQHILSFWYNASRQEKKASVHTLQQHVQKRYMLESYYQGLFRIYEQVVL